MKTVDFIYRFDPNNSDAQPATPQEARELLEEGNRLFAQWTDSCQIEGAQSTYVVQCSPLDLGLAEEAGKAVRQSPFAVLLGCADARVPAEMIFGQMRNNLFVVRMAGNILSDEALGSVEYALLHMSASIRIVVVLGHTGCGAVSAAVDTYLNPWAYLEKVSSHALRSIIDRIFVPVRKAAGALKNIWGPEAASLPGYREALIETAVYVNAAQAAYNLRLEVDRLGKSDIKVVYAVFDLASHRIWTVPEHMGVATTDVKLADAPATLDDFEELSLRMAIRMAKKSGKLKPKS